MLIRGTDAPLKLAGPMKIYEYKFGPEMSGAYIEIDGDHGALRCPSEDRVYYFISGAGRFTLGERSFEVGARDAVFVPKDTPYNLTGKMTYFLVCGPEFKPEHDIFLR